MKNIFLGGLLLITGIWGCTKTNSNIIIENATKILDVQAYIDTTTIKYIPLETKENCLIGRIKQLLITDSNIFIVNNTPNVVYKFEKNGRFVQQIGSIGRGANEYLSVECIDVNEKKKEIILYDSDICRALKFDYEGNFLCSFSNIDAPYGQIIYLDDSLYALENQSNNSGIENNPKVLILNDSGTIVNKFILQPELANKKSIIPTSYGFFSKNNIGNYYIPLGSDTIYKLSSDGKNNEALLSLGIQNDMMPMDISQSDYDTKKSIKLNPISDFHISNEGIFVGSVGFNERPVSFIGSLTDNIKVAGFAASDAKAWPGLINVQTSYQDYFVGLMGAANAIQFKDKFPNIEEDSNPIVIFFKYKLR